MGSKNQCSLTMLREELSKRPLVTNLVFSLIQIGLEHWLEQKFNCPCKPIWNTVFSSAVFIIPAIMAFALMRIIHICKCDVWCKKFFSSSVPAIVWLILLFFNGQYLTCAMTYWEGNLSIDKTSRKWCKPNVTSIEQKDNYNMGLFYHISQGTSLVLVIFVGLIACVIKGRCKQEMKNQDGGNVSLQEAKAEAEAI